MKYKYAQRMSNLKASEIREILKVTQRPEVISFAGGLPVPELFPIEEIKAVNQLVLEESGFVALQYTTTEGYLPLREWLANRMNTRLGTSFEADQVLITHGSQQALDLAGKVFLDKVDVVCVKVRPILLLFRHFVHMSANLLKSRPMMTAWSSRILREFLML